MSEIKRITEALSAPSAIGPYSLGMRIGDTVRCSGQLPLNEKGDIVEGGISQQTHRVIQNINAIMEELGASLKEVVDVMIAVSDMKNFPHVNSVYEIYFPSNQPTRAVIESPHLPKGVLVEMKAEAHSPQAAT